MKSQIFAAGMHMESLLIQLATPAAFELATFSLEAKRLTLSRVAVGPLTDLLAHGPRWFHPCCRRDRPASTERDA